MNVNQIITQRIIQQMKEALEKGEKFYWVRPFSEGAPEQPFSYEGSVPYRGINRLLLRFFFKLCVKSKVRYKKAK